MTTKTCMRDERWDATRFENYFALPPTLPSPWQSIAATVQMDPALRARSNRTFASGSAPTTRSPGLQTVGEVAVYDTRAGAA